MSFRHLLWSGAGAAAVLVMAVSFAADNDIVAPRLCAATKSSTFASMQPCAYCGPKGECSTPTEKLIWESQRAVAAGDIATAISRMEAAVVRNFRHGVGEGPWAHLAELYCVQSSRETDSTAAAELRKRGLNLLREHRCARRMRQSLTCALPDWRNTESREWTREDEVPYVAEPNARPSGFVPNPDVPPMCFVTFCGAGFQNDDDGERRSTTFRIEHPDDEGFDGEDPQLAAARAVDQDDRNLMAAAESWCNTKVGAPR